MATEPDFIKAKRKTQSARQWRGDVNVSLGDETVTFKHRLLWEPEFTQLQQVLDLDAVSEGGDDVDPEMGQSDAQQRVLELQQKADLTDEEEAELRELSQEVASETEQIRDALGDEGFELLQQFGTEVIDVADEDVRWMKDQFKEDPQSAMEHLGMSQLPSGGTLTMDEIRDQMRAQLVDMITHQPYPIKLNVGLQAMSETISVLGNGLPE